ncbi:MAG: DUF4091 domain-containing protein [Deltaproteobacteria bacterium]|nr:DUF4091 domain-containing protein [Deltaproteobacteria bacterium]
MNVKLRPNHKSLVRLLGLLSAGPLLTSATAHAAAQVYGESPMVKVVPSTPGRADSGVGLSAARNEFVSFQVVVAADAAGAPGVSASMSGLSGPSSIGASDIRLYKEAFLNTTTPSTSNVQAGAWPDALVPDVDEIANEKRNAFPFDVPANSAQAIWVDVHVPADAQPGSYTGTVQVTGGATANIPVTLTVVDASLPSTAKLPTVFDIAAPTVCQAHTGTGDCGSDDAMFALLGKYEQMSLEHRFTLANIIPKVPDNGDWSNIDRWDGPYLDGSAPNRLTGAQMTSAQYMAPQDPSGYAAFNQHFQAKGWGGKVFDYSADEPPYGSSFSDAASREALVKSGDPSFRTLVTTTIDQADANGLTPNLNIIVPPINYMDGTDQPYVGDQRASYANFLSTPGHELWLYQSCMSHGCAYGTNGSGNTAPMWPSYVVDAPASQGRAMEWLTFLEQASGELYYQTAQALTSAWTDQYQYGGNGDGTLFYPGTTNVIGGSTDVPVASIRMKLIRLGEQDYEWLKMVSDAGDPGFAQQVARTLLPTAHDVPADGSGFENARLQLISRYLQLTGKQAATQAPGSPPATPSTQAVTSGTSPTTSQASTTPGTSSAVAKTAASSKGGGCVSTGGPLSLLALLGTGLAFYVRRKRIA